jgi:hypothetical protein
MATGEIAQWWYDETTALFTSRAFIAAVADQ